MESVTHPDEGRLQAYLDGELETRHRDETRRHLETCDGCRATVAELRTMAEATADALPLLDVESPGLRPSEVLAAHRAGRSPRARRSRALFPSQPWLRAAAVLVLALGVTATALPGSPVRGWIGSGWGWLLHSLSSDAGGDEGVEGATATPAATEAGVRVGAVDGEVRVSLRDLEPGTEFQVILVDEGQVGVFAGPGTVFTSRSGVVQVESPTDEVRIEIPRGLGRATVEVNGIVYLRKVEGRLELAGPAEDSTASTLRFRVSTPSGQ